MNTPDSDVLIVGAGPSGSALAGLLARSGLEVTVVDRQEHPRPKPCGELLNPGAVAALDRLGLLDAVIDLAPARIDGWRLRSDHGPFTAGRYGDAFGLSAPRAALDQVLAHTAVERGARLESGIGVRAVRTDEKGWPVAETIEADGTRGTRTARLIVGADGLRSLVRSTVGAARRPPRLRKVSLTARVAGAMAEDRLGTIHLSEGRAVGISPVSEDRTLWNTTVVIEAARGREVSEDPRSFVAETLRSLPIEWSTAPEIVAGPWASGPFDRPTRSPIGRGVLLAGDAAGYFDPLTGQGLYRAFRSAELAAPVVLNALRTREVPTARSLRPYARSLRRTLRPGRSVQWIVEQVVSRSRLRDPVLGTLARTTPTIDRLIRVTGDHTPVRTLLAPRALAALAGTALHRPRATDYEPFTRWSPTR